ncbi:GNAT family N-acetyltransferase [Streptacidiphilus jiangxiensis]|uniref:Acetyltransferase (GNAT) family protein n=1 Tax=Streptacidiphilus jiangxiensis TaxID=235985 RepID=A0A1H7U5I6_STRJI|nr:GNAT family N-acetyltransferase [Streptacidiphilus jiangxiensis]SEL92233.1 Acetyltransferase (GNAT) family protein [Streptacidiphilus jiangxiensis]
MTDEWYASPERWSVVDDDGAPVADFVQVRGVLGGHDFWWAADLRPVAGVDPARAAGAVLRRLPGWMAELRVTGPQDAFARLLLDASLSRGRYAHHYVWDFALHAPDPAWAEPALPPELTLAPPEEVSPRRLHRVHRRAYPRSHPDHPAGDFDRVAQLAGGELFGGLLPGSAVALVGRRPVAAIMIGQENGDSSLSASVLPRAGHSVADLALTGPAVVDLFRDPEHAPPGVGGTLLRRALALTAKEGAPSLVLTVTEGNPARALYERTGFTHAHSTVAMRLPR